MKSSRLPFSAPVHRRGFSLVELLVVLAIIGIMSALAIGAFTALGKSDGFNSATTTISTLLEQARTYAMANNTYVFVGIEETDGSTPSSGAQNTGVGRVAIQAFASLDGTFNLTATNLAAINRLQILNNVHLPASLSATSGTLPNRPTADYSVGNSSGASAFPTSATPIISSNANYTFSNVIAFNSLGSISLPTSPPKTGLQYIEIDAQPANGNFVPTAAKNVSAIQLDATTGVVSIYRS